MKYVLVVGPKLIPTDGMILEGSKYLLNAAGIHINEYIQINDHDIEDIEPKQPPTHIIVLGTPWIWHKCHLSFKYTNLANLFYTYFNAKILFLGIGSCLPIEGDDCYATNQEVLNDLFKDYNQYSYLFKGSTIIVRDKLADSLLTNLNVYNLPCPAHWAAINESTSTTGGPVMFWYDPTLGISKSSFKDTNTYEYYCNQFRTWFNYYNYTPTIYCISEAEIPGAILAGLPKPRLVQDVNHAKIIIANAERIISGRVHLAVPAKGLRKPTTLIAVDTRARTLYDHLNRPTESLNQYKIKYIQILEYWYK